LTEKHPSIAKRRLTDLTSLIIVILLEFNNQWTLAKGKHHISFNVSESEAVMIKWAVLLLHFSADAKLNVHFFTTFQMAKILVVKMRS